MNLASKDFLYLEAAHFKPNEVMFNDYCRFIDLALNKT